MGRWSATYYDEVLGSKLKSLVCGAIERAKLEKEDPPAPAITYESFVQDLDHRDSFTTILIEILVKELAERKARPSSADRHLIADRTVKSLLSLGHNRTFHERPASSRRSLSNNFFVSHNGGSAALDWDVLTQGADDDDLDLDDEILRENFAARLPHPVEPVYHPLAGASSSSTNAAIRRSFPVQTTDPGTDDEMPPAPVGFPTRRSPPAHFIARHSSLSRQPSIRRPGRSRTNDFNEFTSRRRSSGRSDQASQSLTRTVASGTGDSSSSMDIANLLHSHSSVVNEDADNSMPVAFASPLNAGPFNRRFTRIRSADEREYAEPTGNSRFTPFTLHSSGSSAGAAPSSSRMHISAPRLRRGGVRAPEQYAAGGAGDGYTHTVRISSPPIPGLHSLSSREDDQRLPLPRRSSSAEMEHIIQTASERINPRSPTAGPPPIYANTWDEPEQAWPSGSTGPGAGANTGRQQHQQQQAGTPANLPTPRSVSPENNSGE